MSSAVRRRHVRLRHYVIEETGLHSGPQHFVHFRVGCGGWLRLLQSLLEVERPLVGFSEDCLVDHRDDAGIRAVVRRLQARLQRCAEDVGHDFGRRLDSTGLPNLFGVVTGLIRLLLGDAEAALFQFQEGDLSDAGNFASFIHRYIGFRPGQVFLSSVVGAMGSGVPMAVAAGLRRPGKQVVAFVGDGGALMTGNELATARMYGVNPILIVSDNKMYGTIGMHHVMRYPGRPYQAATGLRNPDFAAWGRSFGAEGMTISTEAEVGSGIARAFAVKDRPVVVHVLSSADQMSAWRRRG